MAVKFVLAPFNSWMSSVSSSLTKQLGRGKRVIQRAGRFALTTNGFLRTFAQKTAHGPLNSDRWLHLLSPGRQEITKRFSTFNTPQYESLSCQKIRPGHRRQWHRLHDDPVGIVQARHGGATQA